jgi:hypothetical protein
MTHQNVFSFRKLLASLVFAVLLTMSGTTAALAKNEERLRTEALEIFFPKSFKAPKSGCSIIPIKYEWRFFLNHETIVADITLETKTGWAIGEVSLEPDVTGGKGLAEMKICSTRWIGEPLLVEGKTFPGSALQKATKGTFVMDLYVTDFDNRDNVFQWRKKPFRLT